MNSLLFILIIILFYVIYCQYISEDFDETKIKTGEVAESRLKEFDYNKYKPYLDKYFSPINIIDLKKIPVNNDGKIFCSIASYRDLQCPLTVIDMVKKAKNPEKLVICICQQNANEDVDCLNEKDYAPAKVKFIKLSDRDARGPCWARYLIQQEWRGEEYFLQVDSHMRWAQDWDQKCIDDLKVLPPKSCLSNYVPLFNLETGKPEDETQVRGGLYIINKETYKDDGFFRVTSDFVSPSDKPLEGRGWGACFSFSNSALLHDAPYDPYTPHLFFGEEMDILARMFTRGWRVYASSKPICFTNFNREYRPTFWENPDQAPCDYLSRLRLYYRFGYLNDIPKELKIGLHDYNLGKDKTWHQFLEYCLDDDRKNQYGDESSSSVPPNDH
jgi:hypothetical protein